MLEEIFWFLRPLIIEKVLGKGEPQSIFLSSNLNKGQALLQQNPSFPFSQPFGLEKRFYLVEQPATDNKNKSKSTPKMNLVSLKHLPGGFYLKGIWSVSEFP